MQTSHKIIHILLSNPTPQTVKELARVLSLPESAVEAELEQVEQSLATLDLQIVSNNKTLSIVVANEVRDLLEKDNQKELQKPLSESALQTLSVIVYKKSASKAEVDFVRGVDSSRSIKTLLLRGMIEKHESKNKKYYTVSTEALKYMGVCQMRIFLRLVS
jgi:segregation and condensation protein B